MASESTAQAPERASSKASSSDTINLPPTAREVLENYSLIPSNEVAPHVARIVCHLPSPYSRICEACALLTALSLGRRATTNRLEFQMLTRAGFY